MRTLSLLTTVIFTTVVVSAHLGPPSPLQDLGRHVYCGRQLARMMAVLCFDQEPDDVNKRSGAGMLDSILSSYYYYKEMPEELPIRLNPESKSSLLTQNKRRQDIASWMNPTQNEDKQEFASWMSPNMESYFSQNRHNRNKDSFASWLYPHTGRSFVSQNKKESLPWLNPATDRSLVTQNKNKRFVVNECCDNPCTVSVLMSYC